MIHLENLQFRYPSGEIHLRIPSLQIAAGERVAIIGASGSGKTTLLDLLAGIRCAQAGRLEVAGCALSELSEAARRHFRLQRIGLIFQTFELLEYLDLRDNLLLPFRLDAAVPMPRDAGERAAGLARHMGLPDHLDRRPGELSQGERQRAAICRALVTQPELILADEPTGNLDPDNKQRVLRLLLDQVRNHDATLVMVTHDRDLLAPFDRVIDMREFRGNRAA